jgi:hypothetical protein
MLSHADRLKRLKRVTGLPSIELAEQFGVTPVAVYRWLSGRAMSPDCQQTLLRLEGDHLAELAPTLSPEAIRIFNEGRKRA